MRKENKGGWIEMKEIEKSDGEKVMDALLKMDATPGGRINGSVLDIAKTTLEKGRKDSKLTAAERLEKQRENRTQGRGRS